MYFFHHLAAADTRHDDETAVSRLVFDLGRHFMLRISGAVVSLTCMNSEPGAATVRLDLADSHEELLKRLRLWLKNIRDAAEDKAYQLDFKVKQVF